MARSKIPEAFIDFISDYRSFAPTKKAFLGAIPDTLYTALALGTSNDEDQESSFSRLPSGSDSIQSLALGLAKKSIFYTDIITPFSELGSRYSKNFYKGDEIFSKKWRNVEGDRALREYIGEYQWMMLEPLPYEEPNYLGMGISSAVIFSIMAAEYMIQTRGEKSLGEYGKKFMGEGEIMQENINVVSDLTRRISEAGSPLSLVSKERLTAKEQMLLPQANQKWIANEATKARLLLNEEENDNYLLDINRLIERSLAGEDVTVIFNKLLTDSYHRQQKSLPIKEQASISQAITPGSDKTPLSEQLGRVKRMRADEEEQNLLMPKKLAFIPPEPSSVATKRTRFEMDQADEEAAAAKRMRVDDKKDS